MTRTGRFLVAAITAILVFCQTSAQSDKSLTRDEVSVIKEKLVSAFEALGQQQTGYQMERENYSLPTDASIVEKTGRYYPTYGSATREYGTEKAAEKTNKDLQNEYEQKVLEAQSKGNYEEMAKLMQEMNKKMSTTQMEASKAKKEPIHVNVTLNSGSGGAIDPDAVVFEKSGVIALRQLSDPTAENGTVRVFFDPVSLKDTKQLSKVDLKTPEGGVAKKTTVLNICIDFSGPIKEIEAWAKRIDTKKVLSQIDAL
jgi:hypothetical protein